MRSCGSKICAITYILPALLLIHLGLLDVFPLEFGPMTQLHQPGRAGLPGTSASNDAAERCELQSAPTSEATKLPFKRGGFASLCEALDYAARGDTGLNFFEPRRVCRRLFGLSHVASFFSLSVA